MNDPINFENDKFYGYKPKRKKGKALTYIALVLVTSLASGLTVGSFLYSKFSADIRETALAALNIPAVSEEGVQKSLEKELLPSKEPLPSDEDEIAADIAKDAITGSGTDHLVNTTLPKGSDVTAIAKKAGPSIVGIRMTVSGTRTNYFGGSNSQTGEGSGIIISKDGYIMTNYHVVSSADPKSGLSSKTVLEVFLPDGREAKATYKGGDVETDLAVIKINLKNLPIAELGDSSDLEVGELAVAIGNPLGMEFAGSVTVGVISALNRTIAMEDKTLNLIQTDAAINEGNSGGALLNSRGQVIGINSVKISASGVEGLGFAIPINDAKPIIDQLLTFGYVKGRPFIGISGREITTTYASYYGLPKGIYITEVTAGSGAEKAGIKAGDVLVGLGGKIIESMQDLDKVKEAFKPGDTTTAVVVRKEVKINLKLTFGEET